MIKRSSIYQCRVASTRNSLHAVLAGWLLFSVTGGAIAKEIPALPEIQDTMAATNPSLVQQRHSLIAERKGLIDRFNKHNAVCSAVEEGSAADVSCLKNYAELDAALDKHIEASKQYEKNYQIAAKFAASQKPAPHTDTSVVDARNAPSGLPPSVQKAIDGAYSSAPPGVSERVRKGFNAVMNRDWPVAKAWFQDALNRDPTNVGLKRLVALAEYSLQPNQLRVPVDARNEPAGLGGGSGAQGPGAPPNKTKPATASADLLPEQVPQESDLELLIPKSTPMDEKEMMDILFGLNSQPPASNVGKTN